MTNETGTSARKLHTATNSLLCAVATIETLEAALAIAERERDALRAENERLRAAGSALIADVKRRHPGEELRCPFMRGLDAALERKPE